MTHLQPRNHGMRAPKAPGRGPGCAPPPLDVQARSHPSSTTSPRQASSHASHLSCQLQPQSRTVPSSLQADANTVFDSELGRGALGTFQVSKMLETRTCAIFTKPPDQDMSQCECEKRYLEDLAHSKHRFRKLHVRSVQHSKV